MDCKGSLPFAEQSSGRQLNISAILLLIDGPVDMLDTQYHCMEIVQNVTQLLNPGQICVDKNNYPACKLSKGLRWRFSDKFGAEKRLCLFGSLHIKKINLSSLLFTNKKKCFRQNYGIVWTIQCWNRLFGVSKPHQQTT